MNYQDPKLHSLLAGQYVLGQLSERARRRFERLLLQDPELQTAVAYWEQRLGALAEMVTPVEPPKKIWAQIHARMQAGAEPSQAHAHCSHRFDWWQNIALWRSIGFTGVALILALLLHPNTSPWREPIAPAPYYIAVLQDQRAQPMMVASINDQGALLLTMLEAAPISQPVESNTVMQVWCVPKGSGEPVSIGILKSNEQRFELSLEELQELHSAEEIAISFEPIKSAPVAKPSGPFMYRGDII